MKSKRPLFCISLAISTLLGVTLPVQAESADSSPAAQEKQMDPTSLDSIKNDLEERLEKIEPLIGQGLIGITNIGTFAVKGTISPEQRKLVNEQNGSLKAYYDKVAKMKGENVETVQKNSAAQMIKDAGPDTWVQDEEGDWYQK